MGSIDPHFSPRGVLVDQMGGSYERGRSKLTFPLGRWPYRAANILQVDVARSQIGSVKSATEGEQKHYPAGAGDITRHPAVNLAGRQLPTKDGALAPQGPEIFPNLRALPPEQKDEQDRAFARSKYERERLQDPALSGFCPDYDPKAPVKPGFYGPPDISKFPTRFTEELNAKTAEFRAEKMSSKAYQSWAQDFFGRMAGWKEKAGTMCWSRRPTTSLP